MRVIAPTFHGLRTLSVHVRNTMTSLPWFEKMERPIVYALRRVEYPSMTLEPEQKDCVQCVYEGKDVFVWLPTGFGKTVCFEVLPFMFDMKLGRVDSLVVVVSPLVSLMIDQVRSLRSGSDRVWRDTDGCTALLGAFQGGPGQQQDLIALTGLTAESFQVRNCSLQCLHSSFAPLTNALGQTIIYSHSHTQQILRSRRQLCLHCSMTKKIHCMFRKQRLPAQASVHCKHEGLWTSTRTPTNILTSFCSRPPKSTWSANINYAHAHAVYTRLFFLRPQRAWVRG